MLDNFGKSCDILCVTKITLKLNWDTNIPLSLSLSIQYENFFLMSIPKSEREREREIKGKNSKISIEKTWVNGEEEEIFK